MLYDRNRACFNCPIYCSKIASIKEGKYKGSFTEGPEYENTWVFGGNCDNNNIGAVIEAEYLCDLYGLDTISCGNVIGFLMECFEKELINETDTGFPLEFGDDDAMLQAIHLIGQNKDVGKIWGKGVKKLSKTIAGSENKAMHVKGMELPAYDPRGSTGIALAYATSDRGGCHLRSWPIAAELMVTNQRMDPESEEYKAEFVKTEQDLFTVFNSLSTCLFAAFPVGLRQLVPMLYAATGLKFQNSAVNLITTGERINNLIRLFNLREGLKSKDDALPKRFKNEPVKDGPLKGNTVDITNMLEEYYMLRGWDTKGRPAQTKLEELGLEEMKNV